MASSPNFMPFLQRKVIFVTSCLLSGKRSNSEIGSTLIGKNLLLKEEINSFKIKFYPH